MPVVCNDMYTSTIAAITFLTKWADTPTVHKGYDVTCQIGSIYDHHVLSVQCLWLKLKGWVD